MIDLLSLGDSQETFPSLINVRKISEIWKIFSCSMRTSFDIRAHQKLAQKIPKKYPIFERNEFILFLF
jgi:hypothetical protein